MSQPLDSFGIVGLGKMGADLAENAHRQRLRYRRIGHASAVR